jgi:O-antigen/teichoic acid export membrane protein
LAENPGAEKTPGNQGGEESAAGIVSGPMSRLNQLARSVASNWAAFATSVVVAFFLSPFIVHHLGNAAYGVWTLVISMISFMSLLDLGMRGAVTRFVGRNHAQGNHQEASRAVSAAFWLRLWIALLILVVSLFLCGLAPSLFHIPKELQFAARGAIMLTGASFALTLSFGVFGGVLVALNRFSTASGITVSQTLLRAVGVVTLLIAGHGILSLALWEFVVSVAANAALWFACSRAYPELRVVVRRPETALLRQFVGYSFYVFLIHCATTLIYYVDNLVVGAFISAAAVTFYAIGASLLEYLRQVVTSVTTIFMPLASGFEARGEHGELRRLLIQGTRLALIISLPIALILYFRGHTFIELWMGQQYAQISARVLQILLLAQVFSIANFTSGNIAFGTAKHRPFALAVLAESLANLGLSIFLVRRIGMNGVAWGTVVPNLIVQFVFWPRYICKLLDMPVRSYLWQSWARPALAAIPFGMACYVTDHHWVATHLIQFFLQIAAILPLFVLGLVLFFWKEFAWQLRNTLGRLPQLFARK